jgi:acetyltransferase-like isoleucine patch superfamily enzyme
MSPLRGWRRRAKALVSWADLPAETRRALVELGRVTSAENLEARRSPTIDPSAWISPLASLRFTERVEIGPRVSVGPYCCVWGGWSHTWARIGADVLLSPGVVVVAGNHGMVGTGPVRDEPIEELEVEIGPGAWIGAHAVVIGCRVGAGAVVGANSVVTSDVPDFAVAVGAPAKVVSTR